MASVDNSNCLTSFTATNTDFAAPGIQVTSTYPGQTGTKGNSGTADGTDQKLDWIQAGAGDRSDDLEIEIGAYFTIVTDNTEGTLAAMAPMMGLEPDVLANHPHALIGSVDQIIETLQARRERYGTSYVTVGRDALDSFAPVVAALNGK